MLQHYQIFQWTKKHMLPVKDKFQYILVILCEAPEICNALIDSFIEYFGTPIRIFCDQDSAFMSQLTQCFFYILMVFM